MKDYYYIIDIFHYISPLNTQFLVLTSLKNRTMLSLKPPLYPFEATILITPFKSVNSPFLPRYSLLASLEG